MKNQMREEYLYGMEGRSLSFTTLSGNLTCTLHVGTVPEFSGFI